MEGRAPRQPSEPVARLLAGYRIAPDTADEMLDATGAVRPVWQPFLRHLASLPPARAEAAFARGDQYLRDAGVFYRLYADTAASERDWPLSHIPVIVPEAEWTAIAEGLIQRADLLEAVVRDLYGPARLVADGHLPAALVAQNPEWLRPLVGVEPRGGHFLHFLAFEIGRNPDGSWFVLGDRTQAPSGAGFALETRVATSRVFADHFAQANVLRLAGFFRAFRDAMNGLRGPEATRVGILTPGPMNDTYYEHAYVARYLGFMLLEGEDLAVQDGQVMVRTVAGLRPVDVLWRRLDSRFADPLELDPASRIGTPGLVAAVRAGGVSVVNALGSGVLEARALMAFMPRLAEVVLGEPLKLPNIATWWCGDAAARAAVRDHADRMVLAPALSSRLPFDGDDNWPCAGHDAATLAARLATEGPALIGQERVTISTAPAWQDGRLVPRPMSLRAFLIRTPDGWQAMPGGFARIGRGDDTAAIALQRGGSVADVWIVSDRPVPPDTMLPDRGTPTPRAEAGLLPARAADNLYWLGRYVERTEHAVRLLRAWHLRVAESGTADRPVIAALGQHLGQLGLDPARAWARALADRVAAARNCASKVRDRFSVDGWAAIGMLAQDVSRLNPEPASGDDAARMLGGILHRLAAFTGLVHDNMYRFVGWRFLTLGRAVERADSMTFALAAFADPRAPEGALDLCVEVGDSVMTHRRRFAVATSRETVIDLLALDEMNPRSVLYQLTEAQEQVRHLPGNGQPGPLTPVARRLLRLRTDLAVSSAAELTTARLLGLRADVAAFSTLLGETYFG